MAAAVGIGGGSTAGVAVSGAGSYAENKIKTDVKAYIDGDGATQHRRHPRRQRHARRRRLLRHRRHRRRGLAGASASARPPAWRSRSACRWLQRGRQRRRGLHQQCRPGRHHDRRRHHDLGPDAGRQPVRSGPSAADSRRPTSTMPPRPTSDNPDDPADCAPTTSPRRRDDHDHRTTRPYERTPTTRPRGASKPCAIRRFAAHTARSLAAVRHRRHRGPVQHRRRRLRTSRRHDGPAGEGLHGRADATTTPARASKAASTATS